MTWMSDAFKKDKRFLRLQMKRGHVKKRDVGEILSSLPDVSDKMEFIQVGSSSSRDSDATPETPAETKG